MSINLTSTMKVLANSFTSDSLLSLPSAYSFLMLAQGCQSSGSCFCPSSVHTGGNLPVFKSLKSPLSVISRNFFVCYLFHSDISRQLLKYCFTLYRVVFAHILSPPAKPQPLSEGMSFGADSSLHSVFPAKNVIGGRVFR